MSKMKGITVGKCEVCGEETGIDSPKVCYGCAVAEDADAVEQTQPKSIPNDQPVPF